MDKKTMKRLQTPTQESKIKRDLFAELTEGMDSLADTRAGKRTVRSHSIELEPTTATSKEIIRVQKNQNRLPH